MGQGVGVPVDDRRFLIAKGLAWMDQNMTPDEQALERLISSKAGYCVTAVGERLAVYRLDSSNEGGQYAVALDDEDEDNLEERYFKTAAEAATFFETHRRRFRMGYDFEGGKE